MRLSAADVFLGLVKYRVHALRLLRLPILLHSCDFGGPPWIMTVLASGVSSIGCVGAGYLPEVLTLFC